MQNQLGKWCVLTCVCAGLSALSVQAQLAIRSVGSVQKEGGPMEVTVVFTEPVDAATGADKALYSLGAGVTINSVSLMTGLPAENEPGNANTPSLGRVYDNMCAVLEVSGLGSASTTLTVNGVKNAAGTSTLSGASRSFVPSGYKYVEVASSPYASPAPGRKDGKVIAVGDQGFDIFNNGRTAWAGEDEWTFVFKEVTGDFDFKARVEFADFGSQWSRAGIIVREKLDIDVAEGCLSRYVTAHADPVVCWDSAAAGTRAGNNTFESNWRGTDYSDVSPGCGDGSHTGFGNDTAGSGGGTPAYPNAWVRLARAGDTITAYYGDNGTDWSAGWARTFTTALPATMYLGPAYCVEWGNINSANGAAAQSRYYLAQVRFNTLEVPYVESIVGTPVGFVATIRDATTKFVKGTQKLWLNGTQVTAGSVTGPDANGRTVIAYSGDLLPNNSTATAKIEFQDNASPVPNTLSRTMTFNVSYTAVPAEFAVTQFSGTLGTMTARAHQLPAGVVRGPGDANSIANGESELQDGQIDDTTGLPWDNMALPYPVEIGMLNASDGPKAEAGFFNFTNTPSYPDDAMPGSPSGDYFAVECVAYLQLKRGAYRMCVNSDDGFKVSTWANGPDVVGRVLGSYNGGRGTTENVDMSLFDFAITADGVYPFRVSYWEGTGDASVEWYTVDYATGARYLINAPEAKAVKSYPTGHGRAYVSQCLPYPGALDVVPKPTLKFKIVNDATSLVDGSVKVTLDGQQLTGLVIQKDTTTGTTSVQWTAPSDYPFESKHTGQLTYNETGGLARTVDLDFTIKGLYVSDLPDTSFWIELEDWDFGNNQSIPEASTMPYSGGMYADLAGQGLAATVPEIDLHRPSRGPTDGNTTWPPGAALSGYVYRTDIPGWVQEPSETNPAGVTDYWVPMYSNGGTALARPGGFTASASYKTGWSGGGTWYDYTRTVPQGIYEAYLAASHWNSSDPPADGQIDADLSVVTAGVGTTSQTTQWIGKFRSAANGTANTLTPLKGADGTKAVLKVNGKTTFRITHWAGDSDWWVLAPVTGVPAKLIWAVPGNGATVNLNVGLSFGIQDFNTTVATSGVKLAVDGADVTSKATIAKTGDTTSVGYVPTGGLWAGGSSHSYELVFTDSASKKYTNSASFKAYPGGGQGMFVIELEDFNYDSGKSNPKAGVTGQDVNVMPYKGGAYAGLGATFDIDYVNDDAANADSGAQSYRKFNLPADSNKYVDQNENMGGTLGAQRGLWDVTANYKIGWVGAGNWQNYTRTFPAGVYSAVAALSYGEAPGTAVRCAGELVLVSGDVSTVNQTTSYIGAFSGPATGGWGANSLIPMLDPSGAPTTVQLGGKQTVRYNMSTGDADYIVLTPAGQATALAVKTPPANVTVDAGQNATFAVVVTGTSPYTYQWSFKGAPIAGATGAQLVVQAVDATKTGLYSVTVTGAAGTPQTASATLSMTGGVELKFTKIALNANGTVTLEWTGGGTLEAAPTIAGPWQTVTGASSPFTFAPTESMLFGRLKQ